MDERYDVCIIGAGTAGFAAAQAARAAGRRMVMVSGPGDLGGTCILRGCMPAKTLLSSTERLGDVDSATDVGIELGRPHIDVPTIIERKRELVDYFSHDRVHELEQFELVRGCARFVAQDAIVVGDRQIVAERFILATGSHIVAPPIPGLRETGYLTSDDVLDLTTIPARVAVIGGGPVGCEFAQYFARLGARVTLLDEGAQLLRNEDPDVAEAVATALTAEGIDVRCGVSIEHCTAAGDAAVITYSEGGAVTSQRVARLLLATGRVPNLDGLGLDAAGVIAGEGKLAVDPYLRTTNPRVFAAGDVLGRRCLVHTAAYSGSLALENAFAQTPRRADFDRFEAHAVYTQPQVGVAGLTERLARERGLTVRVKRHPFSEVGKAVVSAHAEGFVKMIADERDRVVGVAIVGVDAIDLIGEAIALIDHGATVRDVAQMPHLHPTMGEILGRVADDLMESAAESERSAA
jgi:pyruvate/2-oxoglutarate dehydrogenase complex dihydrolipoamide dehydrogenase (E3) component